MNLQPVQTWFFVMSDSGSAAFPSQQAASVWATRPQKNAPSVRYVLKRGSWRPVVPGDTRYFAIRIAGKILGVFQNIVIAREWRPMGAEIEEVAVETMAPVQEGAPGQAPQRPIPPQPRQRQPMPPRFPAWPPRR